MFKFDDKTLMPFGKFKGTALANVPAQTLLYYYDNYQLSAPLKEYIRTNLEVLQAEVKRNARNNAR